MTAAHYPPSKHLKGLAPAITTAARGYAAAVLADNGNPLVIDA